MKKSILLLPLLGLLLSCGEVSLSSSLNSSDTEDSSSSLSSDESSSSLDSSSSEESSSSSSNSSSSESSSSSSESTSSSDSSAYNLKSISEIYGLGSSLEDGTTGENVLFYGTYVKKIYDNGDQLMLTLNDDSYIYVRFSSAQWTPHVNNLYLETSLGFKGKVSKHLGRVEVALDTLVETSIPSISYSLDNIALAKESIGDVYTLLNGITLSNKYNGVGEIVKFSAQAVASDRSDSNKKVVFSDGKNVITAIGDSKLLSADDIGKSYTLIGSLSILRSSPSLLVLSISYLSNVSEIIQSNAVEVAPSYFSKWNTLTDKFKAPAMSDYGTIYKTTCYIGDDDNRTSAYYLGGVETASGSLSDTGVSTSIKGFYLMNELDMSETDLSYSAFYDYFDQAKQVTFLFSMYQFETNWHGWKMFAFEPTISDPSI